MRDGAKRQPLMSRSRNAIYAPSLDRGWRDYAVKNLYEDRWMGAAEFARYLSQLRVEQQEFIESIGLSKKR